MKRAISITSFKNPNTTCEVLRVDDSYPGEGKTKDGHSLHGYEIISAADNDDLKKSYKQIKNELKKYSAKLSKKKELVVLNKVDLIDNKKGKK